MNNRIVDLHCDTLLSLYRYNEPLSKASGHIDLEKLRRGGSMLQCFAIFILTHKEAAELSISDEPYAYFERLYKLFCREMADNSSFIRQVRCYEDIKKNQSDGHISAMLTVEDAVLLEGKLQRLHSIYDKGVRMMSITWNYENSLGFPNSDDPAKHALGLKPFGREAISMMEDLGMIVDVSHLSEGGFYDVAEQMSKPFIASHSCARALCGHSRNLTDDQLRSLAEHGGICGVNFLSQFLCPGSNYTTAEDIVRHMKHIANVAGIESVALGSDFDGIECELEFKNFGGLNMLCDAMSRYFSTGEIEKICSLNALRVFKEVLK